MKPVPERARTDRPFTRAEACSLKPDVVDMTYDLFQETRQSLQDLDTAGNPLSAPENTFRALGAIRSAGLASRPRYTGPTNTETGLVLETVRRFSDSFRAPLFHSGPRASI